MDDIIFYLSAAGKPEFLALCGGAFEFSSDEWPTTKDEWLRIFLSSCSPDAEQNQIMLNPRLTTND